MLSILTLINILSSPIIIWAAAGLLGTSRSKGQTSSSSNNMNIPTDASIQLDFLDKENTLLKGKALTVTNKNYINYINYM